MKIDRFNRKILNSNKLEKPHFNYFKLIQSELIIYINNYLLFQYSGCAFKFIKKINL